MSEHESFQYRHTQSRGLSPDQVREAMLLHEAGWSNVAIGKKLGRHNSNIQRLLKKMSSQSVNSNMAEKKYNEIDKPRRVIGGHAPEMAAEAEPVADKVARLEKELEDARLRADLYEEIINVAEQKFNIQIRKKAGTKR